jgi:hypothetical protein
MNMTQPQGENTLKSAAPVGSFHPWTQGMCRLVTTTGELIGRISKATAAMFSRRHKVSSLQVIWAGILRSDRDRFVPEPSEELRFQVANQMFLCEEGKTLVFDDQWNQDAWDHMNGYRVVFTAGSARAAKEPLLQRLQHLVTRLVRIKEPAQPG